MKNKSFQQLLKFLLVGVLNTGVDYVFFVLLYSFGGVQKLVATALSYCAGVINSYFFNRHWTFKSGDKSNIGEFSKFFLVNIIALLCSVLLMWFFDDILKANHFFAQLGQAVGLTLTLKQGSLITKLVITPFVMLINFVGSKFFIFNQKTSKEKV